ncbi:hypothetical protein QJS10_CPA01g00003 [Acorus calamus]|uniref:CCHC-type domain-containing protein n=1 Tax=Acorus calamus TaxID=4465 RepID=A0AAV9FIZ1_ACOCL|nr:hypothetical protein QJS10_CPA01g00003 [Acorus calamus]
MVPPIDHLFSSPPKDSNPATVAGHSSTTTAPAPKDAPTSFVQAVQQQRIISYTLPEPSTSNGRRVVRLNTEAHMSCLREQELSLVGKFAGRRPSVESIERNISRHWKTTQSVLVGFGTNGCLRFEFKCMEDLEGVLHAAPWYFAGTVLRLKRWDQKFDPSIDFPALVPVWVKIHNLSFDLFRQDLLISIGKGIGKPLRIDAYTLARKRLSYARLCVEINPLEPLIEEIDVITSAGLLTVKIEYEYIPAACTSCGQLGHTPQACPSRKVPSSEKTASLRTPDKGKGILKSPRGHSHCDLGTVERCAGAQAVGTSAKVTQVTHVGATGAHVVGGVETDAQTPDGHLQLANNVTSPRILARVSTPISSGSESPLDSSSASVAQPSIDLDSTSSSSSGDPSFTMVPFKKTSKQARKISSTNSVDGVKTRSRAGKNL